MNNSFTLVVIAVLISIVSCSDDSPVEPESNQPIVSVNTPADSEIFFHGDTITFTAKVIDAEDREIPDSSIIWTSDKDGQIGTGSTLTINSLSINSHRIIISATDRSGLVGSDTISVIVFQNSVPVVTIINPIISTNFNIGDIITFTATANDAEDGKIPDSSIIWTSDKDGIIGTGGSFQSDELSVNSHEIVVTATDCRGLFGLDTVTVVVIQNTAPAVSVISPINNLNFSLGDTITFSAEVTDVEDGEIPGSSIIWTSDKDGQIGTGAIIVVSNLSVNTHNISLTVTDSDENVVIEQITVSVFITFEKTYGMHRSNSGLAVLETTEHGYIVAGVNDDDFYAVKTDSVGNLIWEKRYFRSGPDVARSICELSDGSYIIAGSTGSYSEGESDVYLIKIDNNGNLLWDKTIGYESSDDCRSATKTSDHCVVLTGSTYADGVTGKIPRYLYLVKVDYNGNLIWEKTIGGAAKKEGNSIIETGDGSLVIAGDSYVDGSSGYDNVLLLKTNKDGDLIWEKTYGGIGPQHGLSVCESTDGGYIIAGTTGADMYFLKVDADGNLLWENSLGGDRTDNGKSVKQTTDGNYIIVGTNSSYGLGNNDIWLVKVSNNGEVLWERTFGRAIYDFGKSVYVTSDGGFIISGSTTNLIGGFDIYLLKTDSNGIIY